MTCHDGTGGPTVDAASSHPVGVRYDFDPPERGGLRSPSAASGLGGSIADDLLVNGRVECTSCHDQHAGHGGGTGMLRMSNEGSRLCLSCHDK